MAEGSQDSTLFPLLIIALHSRPAALLHHLPTDSSEGIKLGFP